MLIKLELLSFFTRQVEETGGRKHVGGSSPAVEECQGSASV